MENLESPFDESYLAKLPLAYQYMVKRETSSIGELYRKVKFSHSAQHRSAMVNNYSDFKPLSNLGLRKRILTEQNKDG